MSTLRLISIAAVVVLLPVFLAPAAIAQAGPQVCMLQGSSSDTSSDGSMYVIASVYTCSTNYDGQVGWNAYSGGTYQSGSVGLAAYVCGSPNPYHIYYVENGQFSQTYYSGSGLCYGDDGPVNGTSGAYNYYAWNTAFGNTFIAGVGTPTVSIIGWSGNCNTFGGSSPCTASATA